MNSNSNTAMMLAQTDYLLCFVFVCVAHCLFANNKNYGRNFKFSKIMEWAGRICRLCAKNDEYCVPVFSSAGDQILLRHKMKVCSPITVKRTDVLPQQVCLQCLNDLDNNYEFYQKCKQAQFMLQKMFEENEAKQSGTNSTLKRSSVVEATNVAKKFASEEQKSSETTPVVRTKESPTPTKVGVLSKSPPLYAIVSSGGKENSVKVLDDPSSKNLPTASASTPSKGPEKKISVERASIIKNNQKGAQQRIENRVECSKNGELKTITGQSKEPEISANEGSPLDTARKPEATTGTTVPLSSSTKDTACRNLEVQKSSGTSPSVERTKSGITSGKKISDNSNAKTPHKGTAGKPVNSDSPITQPPSPMILFKASPSSSPMASPAPMLPPSGSATCSSTAIKESPMPKLKSNGDLVYVRCRLCEKEVRQEFLIQHEALHNGEKVNTCLICDKNFVTVKAMESHRCTSK